MQYPTRYSELPSSGINLSPPPLSVHGLRNVGETLQFFTNNGEEHLAVPGLYPYGDRTEEVILPAVLKERSGPTDLLPVEYVGEDYSVFDLPRDMLAIPAIALGNRQSADSDLDLLFANVGRVVGSNAKKYNMRNVGITSLAFLRENGQVLFVPPYRFQIGHSNRAQVSHNLARSIDTALHPVFGDTRIKQLVKMALGGLKYENESAQ